MDNIFCNPDVHSQSWYVACRSLEVKAKPVSIEFCGKRLCLFRDKSCQINALRDQCAHLGAKLSQGDIVSDKIRCPFHHWEFCGSGQCTRAPGQDSISSRKVESYPVTEKWGFIWIWNGPRALFKLPTIGERVRLLRMPSQTIRCHPHVMIVNGLDTGHLSSLHNIELEKTAIYQVNEFSVCASWTGQFRSKLTRLLVDPSNKGIQARFTTIGGNLALAEIRSPIKFSMLFAGKGNPKGFCETQTIVFMPTRLFTYALRVVFFMYYLLHQDREILDDIEFKPDFTKTDIGYKLFANSVNQMGVW
jgi:phenylpropionate dioxygenase-like ring-hydroxylating dioxygenase large terminal subunit